MHIQTDILRAPFHESRSLGESMVGWNLHGNPKGRALNIRHAVAVRFCTEF
jgi:hypothetical protein